MEPINIGNTVNLNHIHFVTIAYQYEQKSRLLITIFIVNIGNATMQHGDPHYSGLYAFGIIGPRISHSPTKHDNTESDRQLHFSCMLSF